MRAQPQTRVSPYSALNSSSRDAVDDARDQLARVDLVAEVLGHEPVQLRRVRKRAAPAGRRPRDAPWTCLQVRDDPARDRERVLVRRRVVVGDAAAPRVDVGAAELLGGDVLAGRRLHERRPADEDRSGAADDDRLVAHRRDVGAARGARAHHDGDLRDAARRHLRLVEEDPPEVVAVGEDLRLKRQERAARVDEVEARQPVLRGDLLRAQVLLHRQREVRAALHRRVVRDDHALAAFDDADARDDARARRLSVVQVPRGECVQLEERRVRVDQPVDPFARRSACRARDDARVAFSPPPRATCAVRSRSSATSSRHPLAARGERVVALRLRREDGHAVSLTGTLEARRLPQPGRELVGQLAAAQPPAPVALGRARAVHPVPRCRDRARPARGRSRARRATHAQAR